MLLTNRPKMVIYWGFFSGGKCPASHPFVYYSGEYCCQTNREKVYTPQGYKCDGSVIQRDSMCCEANRYVLCPSKPCKNYNQPAPGNSLLLKIVSMFLVVRHCSRAVTFDLLVECSWNCVLGGVQKIFRWGQKTWYKSRRRITLSSMVI